MDGLYTDTSFFIILKAAWARPKHQQILNLVRAQSLVENKFLLCVQTVGETRKLSGISY